MLKERQSLKEISKGDLLVKNSGFIHLKYFEDYPDGNLAIGEGLKEIPFEIKRFYFINTLHHQEAIRGKHAHRNTEQIIFCINGSFTLNLDDGETTQTIAMDTPYVGVMLGKMLWHDMTDFSEDCVILVVANDVYKEGDYIRDREEFEKIIKERV